MNGRKDERQINSYNSRVLSVKNNIRYTDQQHKSPTDGEDDQCSVGVENLAFNAGINVNIIKPILPLFQA